MTEEEIQIQHLKAINDILYTFRRIAYEEKMALEIGLKIVWENSHVDEVATLLFNERNQSLDYFAYNENMDFIIGEQTLSLFDESNTFYRDIYRTERSYLYSAETYTVYIPMRHQGAFVGILRAGNNLFSFNGIDLKTINHLIDYAEILAVSLSDYRTAHELQKNNDRFDAVSKITTSLISTLESEKLLAMIMKSIVRDLGFDRVKLYRVNEEEQKIRGILRYDISGKISSIADIEYPLKYHNRTIVNVFEKEKKKLFKNNTKFTQLIKFFPLKAKTKVIGFIEVDNILSRQLMTEERIKNLKIFISQASIAIENADLYKKVESLSIHDYLTGLYNSRYFYKELERELSRAKRYPESMALIMLDIDHFKSFNDNYGHLIGDKILKSVADILTNNIRENDIAARYGGDEFIILLLNIPISEAKNIAERIRESLLNKKFNIGGESLSITSSIGITPLSKSDSSTKQFINRADKALYKAKQLGRNRIELSQ